MRWRLAILVSILLALLVIIAVPSLRQQAQAVLSYNECDHPLSYRLGKVDDRFHFTRDEVLSDIQDATSVWSRMEGKTLFSYSPDAEVTVNFVYDQRQALNTQIQQLDQNLSQQNTTLKQQIAEYKAQQTAFEQKLAAFKAEVQKYNQEGGAPEPVYNELIKEQQDLQKEGDALNARAQQLNLSTQDYNAGVTTLNQDIDQFKNTLAQKPEEGLYNGKDKTITIYFASNHQELLHTLAHEFGHALGMQHVEDKTAIMYPYTTEHLAVTADDLKELQYVCRQQSAVIHYAEVVDIWLFTQIAHFQQSFAKK